MIDAFAGAQYQQQPEMMHSSFNEQGGALLLLYAPREYGTQVIRPYSYQIEGNAVDKLMCMGGGKMAEAISKKHVYTDPDIAGSITPAGNGTPLDMTQVGQCWTFVLMIDLTSPWLAGSAMGAAKARRRIVYEGVCLDEPLSMITMYNGAPTPNMNCPLRFTHMTETVIDPSVGSMGSNNRIMVRSDLDIVDAALNAQAHREDGGDKELYVATPDRILDNVDNGSGINTEGRCALSNQQKGLGIVSTLKSPLAHLRQLCMGLDQQVHMCESATGNTVGNHMEGAQDVFDVDNFKTGVAGEWSQLTTGLNNVSGNISAGEIILLGALVETYPALDIQPMKIDRWSPIAQENGCVDQTKINPKTIFSSMVASAVAAIANNFGFSRIDFSYDSFTGQFDANPQGTFEVRDAALLVEPRDPAAAQNMMANALEKFKEHLFNDLVQCLKASKNGDFQMHVSYMVDAETYVDLNFYDWASLAGEGIYETTNRIANVNTKSVGTIDQFIHNGTVLDSLVHCVYGKNMKNQFGVSAFARDPDTIIDTMAQEEAAERASAGFGY